MLKTTPTKTKIATSIELELNFTAWLQSHGKHNAGMAEKSIQAYLQDLSVFERWFDERTGETFAPASITRMDLSAFFDFSLDVQRIKAATWNRRRVSLSLFCQFCLESGYISVDPFQGIARMAKVSEAPKSLTRTDFFNFMRKCELAINGARTEDQRRLAIRNRAMIALMAYAGLREGEVCELMASDLLLSERQGEILICNGKGNKQATAYIGKEGRSDINAWLAIHPEAWLLFGRITPRQVQRIVSEIGDMAGLHVTPHMLRHTFVYNVMQKTGNLSLAMGLARHSRIEQTQRYALPHKEDFQAAVNSLSY